MKEAAEIIIVWAIVLILMFLIHGCASIDQHYEFSPEANVVLDNAVNPGVINQHINGRIVK